MAISRLGAKRLQGVKTDRISDSLGSSANGTNTGVTLISDSTSINWNGVGDCDVTATSIKKKTTAGDDWDVKAYTSEKCFSGGTITTTFKSNETSSSNTGWWLAFGTDAPSSGYVADPAWFLRSDGKAGIVKSDGNEEGSGHTITTSSVLKMVYTFGTGASTGECKWYIDDVLKHTESSITNPTHKTLNFSAYIAGKGVNTLTLTIDNDAKLGTGCYNFDGSGDKTALGTSTTLSSTLTDGSTDWTIAFWMKLNATEPNGNNAIFCQGQGNEQGLDILFDDRSTESRDHVLGVRMEGVGGHTPLKLYTGAQFIPKDTNWHHYVITADISTRTITAYRDNANAVSDSTGSGTFPSASDLDAPMTFGYHPSTGFGDLNAKLDDCGIWSRILTSDERTSLWNDGDGALVSSLSNKSGLKAYYSFDSLDLNPTVTKEYDGSAGATGWTEGGTSNKVVFENNAISGETNAASVDAYAYAYDLGADVTGDYVLDFTATHVEDTASAAGNACAWVVGLAAGTGAPTGEDPSQSNLEFTKLGWSTSGNPFVYVRVKQDGAAGAAYSTEPVFTIGSSTTLTRYVRLSKSGTSTSVKFFSDSARTVQVGSTVTKADGATGSSQNVRYLFVKMYSQNTSNTFEWTFDDFIFYNGVSDTVGCKNDFSSTSDLEALTGVRTNTIFEETDTPAYWWYNGTKWKTDGGNILLVDNVQKSNTGWTFAAGSTAGDANAYAKLDGSSIRCIDDSTGTGHSVIYDLGSALSNKWVIRFKIVTNKTVSRSSNQTGVAVGMFSGAVTVDGESSQDFIGFNNYNDTQAHILAQYTNNQAPSATNQTSHFDSGTGNPHGHDDGYTAYCEMIRDGGTTTYKMYTDEYSTLIGTNTYSTSTSDVTGLRYFGCKGEGFSDSASHVDTSISSIEIYDGVTSV